MNEFENKCLCCYKELKKGETGYHASCAHKLFGNKQAPILPYTRDNIDKLALEVLKSSTSVTGVQAKLSLDINRGGKNEPDRLTIVGLWGNYILKPQSPKFTSMPELEDLTMKMAEAAKIETAAHSLIRMADGELAYITRRMDRDSDGSKRSMLDMCQLSNRLTEHKYRGAYTQLADIIRNYSSTPMLDIQRFWEMVIFSWITGNSDMHCKNFSLLDREGIGYTLSPAYDLLAVALTGIDDKDELAMPLTGYGVDETQYIAGFDRTSFIEAMEISGIEINVGNKLINRLIKNRTKWLDLIDNSFLSANLKEAYKKLVSERIERIS
ncbi:MAG: type II toxin-antitoxin system HipA family toxin [Mediterranea massiliensis]|nr:type II toxin-antitoxin system HipA family toxin [Mediterranea massiliensis]